jgi:hypothetical protein
MWCKDVAGRHHLQSTIDSAQGYTDSVLKLRDQPSRLIRAAAIHTE